MKIGTIISQHYKILDVIGYGGMATVYLTRDNETGNVVAIKMMDKKLTSSSSYIKRFDREISIIKQFNHPNIPHLIDKGVIKDDEGSSIPFIIMEYVQGITLRQYIKKKGAISMYESAVIAKYILSALSYAYKNGVKAHRDIKPENIMINPTTKEVKVMDFGIAKTIDSNLTHSTVLFTPYYASPEQLLPSKYNNSIDKRSDIYSLGIAMYEMITGRVPYEGKTPVEIATEQLDPNSAMYDNVKEDIKPPLRDIILKCINPDRDKRYQTAEEVINAIEEVLPLCDKSESIAMKKKSNNEEAETMLIDEDSKDKTVAYKANDASVKILEDISPEEAKKLMKLLSKMVNKEKEIILPPQWPMFRGNPQHTGLSPFDTTGNMGRLKWKYRTNASIFSSPAIAPDGTIYIGSYDGYLYAINADGELKWGYKTGSRIESSPAIAPDGTIYIGSYDGYLYAIGANGELKWRYRTNGSIFSSPAIAPDGTIYIGSYDGYLYAIGANGELKWRYRTKGSIRSSPAIASDGTIYIGSDDGYLYAINPSGRLKWKYKIGSRIESSPTIGKYGTIYIGSDDGYLYAINAYGGLLKLKYKTGGWIRSSPAIASDGTVYVGSYDGYLYAINPEDRELKWRYNTYASIFSSPAIGKNGEIYVSSGNGYLYVVI